ncbi:hypothetical protein [Bdellovibrio bacteriovorus]|uniref:hypothetical protein n=1 Tax=Bdellovibrio bacteriovorus TaxID=959 RepID=UPI0035A58603
MTLKNSILAAFAAITLTSLAAEAYIIPGDRGPAPIPRPEEPLPPYPGDDFGNGSGRQEQKVIYLSRRVSNETLALRQLAGIGENYRGYTVESVIIEIRGAGPRSELALLTDGRVEESVYAPQRTVLLRPQYRAVIGEDFRSLQLDVRGVVDIQSVTINLRDDGGGRPGRPDRPGRPGRPDRGEDVPLYVSTRLYGNDRLDLTQYIDMYRYRGYKIQAIEIDASAVYNVALLDVLINGFNQTPTIQVSPYGQRYTVRPQNNVLGQGADSIVLISRGDLDIRGVTLRLSRY